MFSSVYFVLASSLSTAAQLPSYARLVGAGRLSDACSTLASKVEREGEEDDPILLQAYADIQLALCVPIEAEDCYRKAQRAIRDSRTALRIASCRNAGWQAFFQDRFSTAASCFNRVLEEPEASVGEQLESMLGKALVLYHLGCLGAAVSQIDKFSLAAEQVNERGWSNLAAALRYDVWVQHAVRDTESLRDHIYWRSAAHDIGPDMLYESKAPQEQIATSMPLPLARKSHQALTELSKDLDKDLLDGLQRRGFKLDYGEDGTGWQFKYLTRGGGYYFNVGCSDLIVRGEIGLTQFSDIDGFVAGGARTKSGETIAADLIVLATGYKRQEELVRKLFGDEVVERIGVIWGYGEAQELRNMYTRTAQPGLWFIAGGLAQCRINSKYLALQIKACEEGLLPRVRAPELARPNQQASHQEMRA